MTDDEPRNCSFCGTSREKARHLITGGSVAICGDCVVLCSHLLAEEEEAGAARVPDEAVVEFGREASETRQQ